MKVDVDKIVREYRTGMDIIDIAEKYDITYCEVYETIKSDIQNKRNEMILNDIESGITQTEVAKKYGFRRTLVHNIFMQSGVSKKKEAGKQKRNKEILNDYMSGMNPMDIMRKYHISKNILHNVLITSRI